MSNKKTPSLYRNSTSTNSGIPKLKQTQKLKSYKSFPIRINSTNITSFQQNSTKKLLLFIILIIAVILIVSILNSNFGVVEEETNSTTTIVNPTTTLIGNDSIGSVSKSGPYGNSNSTIKIAYIFGVHPRENGSHRLMEQALHEKENNLSYSYYIYQINVTENSTDFSQSRDNGQNLAKKYIVPNILNDTFNAAIDCHYSDGSWGVERFVFTSVENNSISYKLSQDLAEHFDWLEYYNPKDSASSPKYLITPLNEGGVPSIIYESYSYDNNTTTLEHDKEFISFVDQWNFK
ncbi:MAG: hypothetical protein E7Z84_04520 [Methanosphaera stadtmanae]|nr:hypothetical protein [Methanosphaera stadtmanae]